MNVNVIPGSAATLIVDCGEAAPHYLVISSGAAGLTMLAQGRLESRQELAADLRQLRRDLASRSARCNRAMVLLSRPDIETISGTIPPADQEEMPELVSSLVAQEIDDADALVIDFLVTDQHDDGSSDVLAVTCNRQTIESTRNAFHEAGFKVDVITYSGLGSVELLHALAHPKLPATIAITASEHKTELVVLRDGHPMLFRTLQRGLKSQDSFATALSAELHRTLAFIGAGEEDSAQIYLIGRPAQFADVAKTLSETLSSSVSITDAFDLVEHSNSDLPEDASSYANLIGIASAAGSHRLPLNFLSPRRAPEPPNPIRRIAFWSAVAAAVLLVLGFVQLSSRNDQLDQIERKQASLSRLQKRAIKAQELQDVLNAVQAWRRNEIIWLDELRVISDQFPERSESLVRRLSLSAQTNGTGVVDLSVQVSSPEVVTELEAAIRGDRHSVSSKRVAEVGDVEDLDWSFETRIVFRPLSTKPLDLPELAVESLADDKTEVPADEIAARTEAATGVRQ